MLPVNSGAWGSRWCLRLWGDPQYFHHDCEKLGSFKEEGLTIGQKFTAFLSLAHPIPHLCFSVLSRTPLGESGEKSLRAPWHGMGISNGWWN